MADRRYPTADQIAIPLADESSPDQEFAVGWAVQHNRLFVLLLCSLGLNVLLGGWGLVAANRYAPAIQYVTLDGGQVLVYKEGTPTVNGVTINKARLRRVINEYLTSRFAYDYQNLGKLNDVQALLSPEAAIKERGRLTQAFVQNSIIAPQVKVRLELDMDNMGVSAKPDGEFEIKVTGTTYFSDAVKYPDPATPRVEQRVFLLRVKAGTPTNQNADGYFITVLPDEILQTSN